MKFFSKLLLTASLVGGAICGYNAAAQEEPNDPTPDWERSRVWARLNLNIEKDTKEVHFISTNNDPDVLTKTYVLKHADPYELRPYIRSMVRARRVNTDDTKVEAIKYMDGTSILIVSAEDYRFERQDYGMGIDEVVNALDQPKVSSSSGHKFYLYFPKYWSSTSLATVIREVGLCNKNGEYELQGGKDRVTIDTGLNALLFYTPAYSIKTVEEMLKLYDTPTSEALITYTIYQIHKENDGAIGVDFQAWKNGPGSDLFSVASRYTNGWDIANMAVNTQPFTNNSHTEFINFSPRWNTKFLDFLVAKSKATIIDSGTLSIMNNTQAHIENVTEVPAIENGEKIESDTTVNDYMRLTDVKWGNVSSDGYYRLKSDTAREYSSGAYVSIKTTAGGTFSSSSFDFLITRSKVNGNYYYYMELDPQSDAAFWAGGSSYGKKITCFDAVIQKYDGDSKEWITQSSWSTDQNMTIDKSYTRVTEINKYGFCLTMTPIVCENATKLDINMSNTSLIGFQSNGKPRTSYSEVNTQVMVSNQGQKFIIGGLEKKDVVRSVSKLPWLGSIPFLGFIFSSESEVHKTSQIVAVIECVPVMPDTKVPAQIMSQISRTNQEIDSYGIDYGIIQENDYGFDQFLLDKNKTSPHPLP